MSGTQRGGSIHSYAYKVAVWVATITTVLIGIIFILGFVSKYPDTVDGQISITARYAYASTGVGRLNLF